MTRRRVPTKATVDWITQTAVGIEAHLTCGHQRVTMDVEIDSEGVRTARGPGYAIGNEVTCSQCPGTLIDDVAMFEDLREELGT